MTTDCKSRKQCDKKIREQSIICNNTDHQTELEPKKHCNTHHEVSFDDYERIFDESVSSEVTAPGSCRAVCRVNAIIIISNGLGDKLGSFSATLMSFKTIRLFRKVAALRRPGAKACVKNG